MEYKLLTDKESNPNTKKTIRIRWHMPPDGWYKLNIDGAFKAKKLHCGLSGVIRNRSGDWVVGFYNYTHAATPLQVELLALKHGLQLVWDLQLKPLKIETSSTDVLKCLDHGYPTYGRRSAEAEMVWYWLIVGAGVVAHLRSRRYGHGRAGAVWCLSWGVRRCGGFPQKWIRTCGWMAAEAQKAGLGGCRICEEASA
uniref:RNase H type-1 domain-containing protein n=1 Tax=Nicotiana tabacum TaxID=4097 RepID=A0A1S4APV9_TOBAC|nr:PREDICTED: uncharacterized protein LOC107800150 [Nicotiana tabacum]